MLCDVCAANPATVHLTEIVDEQMTELHLCNCGMTYADFKKVGRLGCSECYNSFRKYLLPLLKRIHGSNKHYGKMPLVLAKPLKTKSDIEELKVKLQKAVSIEDFEEAARVRDIIKKLENSEPKDKNQTTQ